MVIDPSLPLALARRHRSTPVGAVVTLAVESDDLVHGGGFERAAAVQGGLRRLRTLPDWVGPDMRLLVCGLNPSLVSADLGVGYAGRSNRFWPAALAAGLVSAARDPELALSEGVGFTDLVKRPSASAGELTPAEYRDGLARVTRLTAWLRPRAVVFVGLAGWRVAVDRRAQPGWQPGGLGGVPAYVMPSTSGLNARVPRAALTDHLRAAVA
ncbi:MAG: mismatch-specific DNA-glycosylase [Acidimicrobiales bacterium]